MDSETGLSPALTMNTITNFMTVMWISDYINHSLMLWSQIGQSMLSPLC